MATLLGDGATQMLGVPHLQGRPPVITCTLPPHPALTEEWNPSAKPPNCSKHQPTENTPDPLMDFIYTFI